MTDDILPDPHAHPELGILIATLEDSTREWRANLGDVSPAALVWQPYENGPSVGGNILHMVDVECWWLRVVAAGEAGDPTRPESIYNDLLDQYQHHWPVPPNEPLKWYFDVQDARRAENLDYIRRQTDPTQLFWDENGFAMSYRWVVAHIVEHDAYHGGRPCCSTRWASGWANLKLRRTARANARSVRVVQQFMKRYVRLGLMVAVPLAIAGWWMFRPEKLFINATVNEAAPAGAKVLASGMFSSEAHPTEGTAELIEADGRRVLRLSNFATTNGPDVRVWLVEGETAGSGAEVKQRRYVELGSLKGNIGDQNYGIPPSVDLAKYRAVSIWCARFSVQFGGATLAASR